MSQSRVCIQKSIEAAKKKCVKKTNLLVYQRNECKDRQRQQQQQIQRRMRRDYVPKITCPQAKQIRVCTGKQLKKMCAPPKCSCDLYTAKKKEGAGFFMTGFKSLLALAIVYMTIQAGIWGDSCETHALYTKLCETFLPERTRKKKTDAKYAPVACEAESELFMKYETNICDEPFLDHEKGSFWLKEKYNKAVYTIFSAIAGFPQNIICLFKPNTEEKILVVGDDAIEDECDMDDEDNYGGGAHDEDE